MSVQEKTTEIYKWLFFLLFLYIVVYIPATFIRESGAQEVSNRVMHTMRCELYEHLQLMSARFHQVNKSGEQIRCFGNTYQQ